MSMPSDMGSMRFQQQAAQTQDTLLSYLLRRYREAGAPKDEVAYAEQFVAWGNRHLNNNRPVRTFSADMNVGVTLSNNDNVLVAPMTGVEHQGEMLKTPLDPRQRQGIPDVYADQGAIPITGLARKQPGSVDYGNYDAANFHQKGGTGEDKTVAAPAVDMTKGVRGV